MDILKIKKGLKVKVMNDPMHSQFNGKIGIVESKRFGWPCNECVAVQFGSSTFPIKAEYLFEI